MNLKRHEHLTGNPNCPKPDDTSQHTYNQNDRKFIMKEEIVEIDAPYRIKLFLSSDMFDMEIINVLEADDATRTKLVASAEFVHKGLIMKVVL